MKTFTIKLRSDTPIVFSKYHDTEKESRELHDAYEKRTWREKLHETETGNIFIPAIMFKNALSEAAKYKSEQIPGKGKSTYTKHFEAGVLITNDIILSVKKEKVSVLKLHVPSDGRRGGTKRVMKYFPIVSQWEGEITVVILDEIITKDVLIKHLSAAGCFIGVGSFRPRNNGTYGRFSVIDVKEVK